MKTYLKELVTVIIIAVLVTMVWRLLELIAYGKVLPDKVDSIIAIILSYSLYANFKFYIKNKTKRKQ